MMISEEELKEKIRTIPNYPKEGILFRDITTLLGDPGGFQGTIDALVHPYRDEPIDAVAGIEARGFILGGAVAHQLQTAFVPVRKKGKLPWETIGQDFELEYGKDRVEVHKDALKKGGRVLVVDDLVATGGTAEAACELVENIGAVIVGCTFVIDLPMLGGRGRLEQRGWSTQALCAFEDDL